jgi:hypothetical protein
MGQCLLEYAMKPFVLASLSIQASQSHMGIGHRLVREDRTYVQLGKHSCTHATQETLVQTKDVLAESYDPVASVTR